MFHSRGDAYFGDDHTFNKTIYRQTKSYWTSDTITTQIAAKARAGRIATSMATNPTFNLTYFNEKGYGYGEPAAYLLALGNFSTHTAERSFVEYLFGK